MADSSAPRPEARFSRAYEEAETQAARAAEDLVGSRGFAGLLGQFAENTAAVTKLSSDAMDLVLRNLRVVGRRDVVRLARQLARTEDKLERVLQEVEQLRDELARARTEAPAEAVSPVKATNGSPARGSAARGSKPRNSS